MVEDEGEDSSSDFQDRLLFVVCFFNNIGDLIIGFKNYIFFIDYIKGRCILDFIGVCKLIIVYWVIKIFCLFLFVNGFFLF